MNIFLLAAFSSFVWQSQIPEGGLSAETSSDSVKVVLSGRGVRSGGDGYVSAHMPLYRRGRLDFDLTVTPPERNKAMAQFMTFYGIRMFWHDSCKDWRLVTHEANANRESGFHDEPVSHKQIAKFKPGERHHCRIAFDYDADRVEFFLDDMNDPAYIAADFSVWGEAEYMGGEIRIGGMGLSRGSVGEFRNIVLTEEAESAAKRERTETLVFNGFASEFYGVESVLAAENPREYLLDFTRYCFWPENMYKYKKLPGTATVAAAKRIVLVDAPAGFFHVLPDFLIRDIVKAANEGAEVTFLEGPFSLDRGEYAGTAFERILPEGALSGSAFPPPRDREEILERKVGDGVVRVLRGFRLGADPADSRARFKSVAPRLFR